MFQYGYFTSHAGLELPWKIDLHDRWGVKLAERDWWTLARIIVDRVGMNNISTAIGIPRGGIELATQINNIIGSNADESLPHLIVDDVYTTGTSMYEYLEKYPGAYGYVVYHRRDHKWKDSLPYNVRALFTVND